MPSLNGRQFRQDPIEGWNQSLPKSMQGYRPLLTDDPDPFDPGPDTKRGEIGVGQQMLNLDRQGVGNLEVAAGGIVPVSPITDPAWSPRAWRHGGAERQIHESDPESTTSEGERARNVTKTWESTPLQTIGPDVEIRSGQTADGGRKVAHDPVQVKELRRSEVFHDDSGTETHPWIAQVEGKRYLLEGHHRAIASRTRGTGEMQAHVIEARNWGHLDKLMGEQNA